MHLNTYTANLPRQTADHLTRVRGVSVHINCQDGSAGRIDADRSSQNLRLPHQVGSDLSLHSHNRPNGGVCIVENTRRRSSERAKRKERRDNDREDFQESINCDHNGITGG